MTVLRILVYLYLLLRPYYFFHSGMLQISDFVILIAFLLFLLLRRNSIKEVLIENKYYLYFLVCVLVINLLYYLYYLDYTFVLSSSWYIFNLIIIMIFSYFVNDESFLNNFNKILKINLIIQLLLCIFHIGNNWYGTYRYMGTFNDPNQFAYYVFISYCIIYLISQKLKKNSNRIFVYFLICLYLIVKSVSTGMLLGISIVALLGLTSILHSFSSFIKKNFRKIIATLFLIAFILTIVLFLSIIVPDSFDSLFSKIGDLKIFNRVVEKFNKLENENGNNILHERGYDTIFSYPQNIIYGAGQGHYMRFYSLTGHEGEIHATIPSILFYYGIIPTVLLLIWIRKKLHKLNYKYYVVYIALFIESFTLMNQRQALFWIVIVLGKCLSDKTSFSKTER